MDFVTIGLLIGAVFVVVNMVTNGRRGRRWGR